jgi:hypothetical protein
MGVGHAGTAVVFGGKNSREKNGVLSGRAAILFVILSIVTKMRGSIV